MVIYFDGVCGLCNGFVDFILKIDHHKRFKFSPLQGEHAQALPEDYRRDLDSVVVEIDGKLYRKSQAVLAIFKRLGNPWKMLSHLDVLPSPFSNKFYDLVAANRYKLFGKRETCRLPTPEERERFLP